MRIHRFDPATATAIQDYGSRGAFLTRVAGNARAAQIFVLHLQAGGRIGPHQAASDQLFMVVEGTGWVRAAEDPPVPIRSGEAAFWHSGEWHESGSDTGLTAILIEAESLDPTLPKIEA